VEPRHRRSGAALGPTVTCGTPLRPDGEPRASTTTTTTSRATMTTAGAGDAMTATMTRPQMVAEPERSTGLWPEYLQREVPFAILCSDQCAKI
jgi:hypothetical protein